MIGRFARARARLVESLMLARLDPVPCTTTTCADVGTIDLVSIFHPVTCDLQWALEGGSLGDLQIPGTMWGVNPGDRRALYHLVRKLRPTRVLEIGTHVGASTAHLAAALACNAAETSEIPRFVTIDIVDVNDPTEQPWRAFGASLSPIGLVKAVGAPFVEFVAEPSLKFMERCGEQFDLIFLDGDHSAVAVYQEVAAATRLLRRGGLILLHDYYPDFVPLNPGDTVVPGPRLAVRRLQHEHADLAALPLGSLPWPTKGGGSSTSLALIGRRIGR